MQIFGIKVMVVFLEVLFLSLIIYMFSDQFTWARMKNSTREWVYTLWS